MSDCIYWIWLSEALGAANRASNILLERFGTAEAVFQADPDEIQCIPGISETVFDSLCDKNLDAAYRIDATCSHNHMHYLTWDSPLYPQRLRRIQSAPVLLYYLGQLPSFDSCLCLGIVGCRKPTNYGMQMAYQFGYELTVSGALVISGMAAGIDSYAHCGALDAGGHTVAVLGSGLDVIYPKSNAKLMRQIIRNGTVLSEYRPGSAPEREHFPLRNRIISGLCQGVTIVEAPKKSGSLITASHAERQGRDISVLPGNVDRFGFVGSNHLILSGNRVAISTKDILAPFMDLYQDTVSTARLQEPGAYDAYRKNAPSALNPQQKQEPKHPVQSQPLLVRAASLLHPNRAERTQKHPEKTPDIQQMTMEETSQGEQEHTTPKRKPLTDENQRKVMSAIHRPCSIDSIADTTGLTVQQIGVICTMLEIQGYIRSLPGGLYTKND